MIANERTTVEVLAGQVMTITPSAATTTGTVKRLTSNPGDGVVYQADQIAGVALSYGPFPEVRWYEIICTLPTVTVAVAANNFLAAAGAVPAAVAPYVVAAEYGNDAVRKTVLTLTALPITMRDTEQGGGAKIYTFPAGRIVRLGATASIAVTTTSILANTLNAGVTCNYGVGSVTQANATVATTEQDIVQVAAFTASATINVAGAVANGVGAGVLASLDGTATAIDAFLNLAVAGATDIDANATVLVSGTITIVWANAGDY